MVLEDEGTNSQGEGLWDQSLDVPSILEKTLLLNKAKEKLVMSRGGPSSSRDHKANRAGFCCELLGHHHIKRVARIGRLEVPRGS